MSERLLEDEQTSTPAAARDDRRGTGAVAAGVVRAEASFASTGIPLVDGLLVAADRLSGGRAALLQRVVSYLFFGGFAAVVNLVALYVLKSVVKLPISNNAHYAVAQVIATELSIMANFIPNDRYTFSRLPGHARSWWARCLRFHSTTIVGALLTVGIGSTLYLRAGVQFLVAQAIAIWISLIFNFTFHHLWTYRHTAPAQPAQ
ncbi:MAG TPA: GtrA family protein [Ktedonobacterales bacterium]|nr:GtrA family protein [Ktedonobacterales bacterium]